MYETDNTLYPYINNDIEYGLFEDVINSYYLDSQIKDDFKCDQECYTDIQEPQHDQPLTPCTHAYDHIAEHINNLDDQTQKNTLYAMEENASLITNDTATPCDFNITNGVQNSGTISEDKSKIISPMGIHSQSKHKYRSVFGDSNIKYHDFNNGDALTFKDKYTVLLQQELQNPYWCLHDLSQPKVIKYLQKWMWRQCHMQCIFQVVMRPTLKQTRAFCDMVNFLFSFLPNVR